ncbi:MAG: DUF2510 domain-containing protein [Actinomycetota bacterium]
MSTPEPGWYDDPEQPGQFRYWDGETWTAHRAPKAMPQPASGAGPYRKSNAGWALGWSVGGAVCCGLLSIVGFVMGMQELRAAKEGQISPSDRGLALAAAIVGGIITAILVLAFFAIVISVIVDAN